jgi:hypothetical protein
VNASYIWGGYYGAELDFGANYNTIAHSTMTGHSFFGLYGDGADTNTVTQSFMTGGLYGAYFLTGSDYNTISYSTMIGVASGGLYFDGNGNTVSQSYAQGNSWGVVLAADGNAFNSDTIIGIVQYGSYSLPGSDSTTINQSYLQGPAAAAYFNASAYNQISLSTAISGTDGVEFYHANWNSISGSYLSGASAGIYFEASDSATVSQSYLAGGTYGALISDSGQNVITLSTGVAGGGSSSAIHLTNSSSNTVSWSFLSGSGGPALDMDATSSLNTVVLSTLSSTGGDALYLSGATFNTIDQDYVANANNNGARLVNGADDNVLSRSTVIAAIPLTVSNAGHESVSDSFFYSNQNNAIVLSISSFNTILRSTANTDGGGGYGVYLLAASTNAFISSYLSGSNGTGLWIQGNSNYNTVSQSTVVSAANGSAALFIFSSSWNAVTQSWILNPAGYALALYADAENNRVSFSTMVAGGGGQMAYWDNQGYANTVTNSYMQGSTAAYVTASTGAAIGGSVMVSTGSNGVALQLSQGSSGVAVSSSSLSAPPSGSGIYLDAGNSGALLFATNTVSGAMYGMEIAAQSAGASLSVASMTFANLSAGATAVNFTGGTFVSTFTAVSFDGGVGADVNGALLSLSSRITMRGDAGARKGPKYENDPNSLVDWPDDPNNYPGCSVSKYVRSTGGGDATTINGGLALLPSTLPGEACVVIEDAATYPEQVTVQGFVNNGSSITIFTDPSVGARAVVSPPAGSTAAFQIANSSVNVFAIDVAPTNAMTYGVSVSSAYVGISSVNVLDASGRISDAGVMTSSWTTVTCSSVTVGAANAAGFWLPGSMMTRIAHSSATAAGTRAALWIDGASSNTFSVVLASATNLFGALLDAGAAYNAVDFSTFSAGGTGGNGLYAAGASSNAVAHSYMTAPGGIGASFSSGASYNTVSASVFFSDANGGAGLQTSAGASYNLFTGDFAYNTPSAAVLLQSPFNTISMSTAIAYNGSGIWILTGSNTVTASYAQSVTGSGINIWSGYNTVSQSTAVGGNYGIEFNGGSYNTVIRTAASGIQGAHLDSATGNLLSLSTFTSSSVSGDAVYMTLSGSNTISQSYLSAPNSNSLYLDGGSNNNVLTQSAFTSAATGASAVYLNGVYGTTMSSCSVSNSAGIGAYLNGAGFSSISYSTFNTAANGQPAITLIDASTNVFIGVYANNPGVPAVNFANSNYNAISQSTAISNHGGSSAVGLTGSSFNAFTGDMIANPSGHGLTLYNLSNANTVSQSTITNADSGHYALYLYNSASNTITASYVDNASGYGAYLLGSSDNSLLMSTAAGGGTGYAAAYLSNSSSNTFAQSLLSVASGDGAYLDAASSSNTFSFSTMTAAGSGYAAVRLVGASYNVIMQSSMRNPAGHGVYLVGAAASNQFSFSTMTSGGAGQYAFYAGQSASNTVTGSYLQGSTAAFVNGSTSTVFNSTVFVATNSAGAALQLGGGSVNLTLSSSSLSAPSGGAGIDLDAGNTGVMTVATNTVRGAQYGMLIGAQSSGASLSVTSMTFANLAPGATAVNFTGGTLVSTFTTTSFDPSIAVNVNGSLLALASRITMRAASGRQGPGYEDDPNSLVDWPDLVPPSSQSLWFVGTSSIGVQFGTVGADGYTVAASTKSDFSGVVQSSTLFGTQSVLAPAGLDPNTTYYLRAGSLYGGTTVYFASSLSTATLSKLATGTTVYQINVTSMAVNWLSLPLAPPEASSNSASGYLLQVSSRSDFTPLWTASTTPNVALSTLTAFGLTGGVTYYFRVGTLNVDGAANYATAVSTLMPIQLGVAMTTHTLSLPGLTNMNATVGISTSIVLTNTGNVSETYFLSATTTTAGSPWKIAAAPGADQFALWGVVNSTQPAAIDFAGPDQLSDAEAACGSSAFTMGNQACVQVPAGGVDTLWMQLATPKVTSTAAAQDIRITARAVKDP